MTERLRNSPIRKIDTGTYAYEKLIETVCYSVIDSDRYMILGGSYEIPLMHGLLDPDQMMEVLSSPTYGKESIDREYRSIWSGSKTGAAFGSSQVQELRKIVRADTKSGTSKDYFYVLSADMAKDGSANTVIIVYKVKPGEYSFSYNIVNLEQVDTTDYEKVSLRMKQMIADYNAELLVYDANGVGATLRDWLNKEQLDPQRNIILPAYGIINPPEKTRKDLKNVSRDKTIIYEVKAQGEVTSHINKIFFSKMGNKTIRFLVKKEIALEKFSQHKSFLQMSSAKQKRMLLPYVLTDKLEEEMKNLDIVDNSDRVNPNSLKVIQRNKKIQKDYYSAASYGVYGIHTYLEVPYYAKKRKKKSNIADYIMIT